MGVKKASKVLMNGPLPMGRKLRENEPSASDFVERTADDLCYRGKTRQPRTEP